MPVVKLETAKGELVTFADLPPLRELPFVLVWGLRHFTAYACPSEGPQVYREAVAMAVCDPNTPRREP